MQAPDQAWVLLPRYSLAKNSKKYDQDDYQYTDEEPIVLETNFMSRDDPMLSDDDPRSNSNFSKQNDFVNHI